MTLGWTPADTGLSYVQTGLQTVRDFLMKVADWIPIGTPELTVTIVFALASLWIGSFIMKRFVTRPLALPYILWTLVITISIFLNLMYL